MYIPTVLAPLRLIIPLVSFIAFEPAPTAYIPILFGVVTLITPLFTTVPLFETAPVASSKYPVAIPIPNSFVIVLDGPTLIVPVFVIVPPVE